MILLLTSVYGVREGISLKKFLQTFGIVQIVLRIANYVITIIQNLVNVWIVLRIFIWITMRLDAMKMDVLRDRFCLLIVQGQEYAKIVFPTVSDWVKNCVLTPL